MERLMSDSGGKSLFLRFIVFDIKFEHFEERRQRCLVFIVQLHAHVGIEILRLNRNVFEENVRLHDEI